MLKNFFEPRLLGKTVNLSKKRRALLFYNPSWRRRVVFGLGTGLFLWGLATLTFFYAPLAKAYLRYKLTPRKEEISLPPPPVETSQSAIKSDFYLFIPKIKASAKIYADTPVDNREAYLEILKRGVAHAKGSAFPGGEKTIYLFAHSTHAPFDIVRYNAVFFLLNELQNDDLIIIFYNG